jgi:membrane protein implicated in regulation of membrane protease activity
MLSDAIAQYGPWLWFAAGVILLVLETIVPGVHFIWFGCAAGIVGVLALLVPIAWQWQVLAFAAIAFATVVLIRRNAHFAEAKSDEPSLNVRGAHYIGRRVVVAEAIVNGRGRVKVDDTVWAAQGEDAPRGARVHVTGVNGTVLVVANPDSE